MPANSPRRYAPPQRAGRRGPAGATGAPTLAPVTPAHILLHSCVYRLLDSSLYRTFRITELSDKNGRG